MFSLVDEMKYDLNEELKRSIFRSKISYALVDDNLESSTSRDPPLYGYSLSQRPCF